MKSLILFILLALTCPAQEQATQQKEEPARSLHLFNGKDLSGWKIVGGDGKFKIQDGAIQGYGKNIKASTFLRTEETYKNFTLSYQFKFVDRTGNSGIMFRALQKPSKNGNGRVHGYQCEADNKDRSWTAGLFDEARRGWLSPTKKSTDTSAEERDAFTAQGKKLFKWDDWNSIVIKCVDNRIQTWLNGELRVDFTDTDTKDDTREGFIALQVHAGKSSNVMWQDLKLETLP